MKTLFDVIFTSSAIMFIFIGLSIPNINIYQFGIITYLFFICIFALFLNNFIDKIDETEETN